MTQNNLKLLMTLTETASSEAVLDQDLSHKDQTLTPESKPEVNIFTPSGVVLLSQNEQMFDQSDMFLNSFRSISRCMEQLKKLTVSIVVTRRETAADDRRTEPREVIHQGSGTLLTRPFRRRILEDLLTQEAHILGSQESYDDFKLYVQTTRDLINDDVDAGNATVSIYNINGNGEDVLSIRGHHAYHSAIPGDRTVTLICQVVTREIAEIVERLKGDFFRSIQQIPEEEKRRLVNKAIMVSCPRGRGPRVSVGDFKEVKYLEYRSRTGDMRFKRVNATEGIYNIRT
ncbi:unnamed protein product [Lymnaea stagnalis]|uniref:Uncharacterized protein n=1 Tax=Lymnaea stagnalis TaxID=6523 RepID=A0AAV2HY33_LYMST